MEAQDALYKTNPSLTPIPQTAPSAPDQASGEAGALPPTSAMQEGVSAHIGAQMTGPGEKDVLATATDTGQTALAAEKHETHAVVADAGHTLLAAEEHEVLQLAADAKHLLAEAEEYEALKVAVADAATFGEFWLKFLNDWAFNFASGLAYHLLMAMFPIVIAVGAIVGFIEGGLSQATQRELISYMSGVFPSVLGQDVLAPAMLLLRKDAGSLGIIAIVLALYSGSRLFSCMEDCFAIIYHTPTRSFWQQNLMALVILLVFILLIPVMLLASSIGLGGFLGGLIASLILFQAIYMIVPNQGISLRKSWRGTLVAAVALQIYVVLFPIYIRHFLGSYTGNTGFAIILLLFFYYFALILLIGAEVNAFYAEGVRAKPLNLAEMVHRATLSTDKAELLELACQRECKRRAAKR